MPPEGLTDHAEHSVTPSKAFKSPAPQAEPNEHNGTNIESDN